MSLITLEGKRGLVVGIANDSSIAYGCAKAFRALGAELAVTYLNAKAERHVKPLADMPSKHRKRAALRREQWRVIGESARVALSRHVTTPQARARARINETAGVP